MKERVKVGNVLTDEIVGYIGNVDITDSQIGKIVRSIFGITSYESIDDTLVKVIYPSLFKGYAKLTVSCAEGKIKELNRLKKYYTEREKDKKKEKPEWFDKWYEEGIRYLYGVIGKFNNVSGTLANITEVSDNVSGTLANITEASDNVSGTLANITNWSDNDCKCLLTSININTNTNTKPNTNTNTKTNIEYIPPKSPKGDCGEISSSVEPRSVLDDPGLALGVAKEEAASEDSGEAVREEASRLAEEIERTYRYHVNPGKLRKSLISVIKKSGAEKVRDGYRAWLDVWSEDGFEWAPQRITDWLFNMSYLDAPRRGNKRTPQRAVEVATSELC